MKFQEFAREKYRNKIIKNIFNNHGNLPMELQVSSGMPYPFGNTTKDEGINFAIAIKDAEQVTLCFFEESQNSPFQEIQLDPIKNRTGNVWHALINGLPPCVAYGYRVTSNDQSVLLFDPYAKSIASHASWGELNANDQPYHALGKVVPSNYDWEDDAFPKIASKDLIIYEMHVRGFTQDTSSEVTHPGTFSGIIEKIPYLKSLGVNALELLPLFEFNECENMLTHPRTQEKLFNYFGYSTVSFFSPMNRYASNSTQDNARNEFRDMVKALHKNGIEVILDVVFNHTFEGNEKGPNLCYKGLDLNAYYMIDPQGNFLNFSGCGNTINSNHPLVISLVLESLRYWVTEMHVDGFRFDLATIMTRAENGAPIPNAPLVEAISKDPVLANTKLIAEAWDAGGLYQVGGFYPGKRWSEWNGKYRDVVRRFIKGTHGHKTAFATALSGSQDLYGWRESPACSVNFITAHDGFSLADLVTYNQKHNLDNGEENRDGFDHNDSWNCGFEGHSSNKKVVFLRERQIRNFTLALILSQGIPMIIMGDEYAHTRHGNNNTWCQDNELNWFLWNRLETRPGFHRFFKSLIQFRNSEPLLRRDNFLSDQDVSWHGTMPNLPDWEKDNNLVALSLNTDQGPQIYAAFNASHIPITINIPQTNPGFIWHWIVNTHNPSPEDFFDMDQRKKLEFNTIRIPSYSAYLLRAMPQTR